MLPVSFTESATRVQRSNLKSAAWGLIFAALALCNAMLPAQGEQSPKPSMEVLPLRGAISLYDKACVRCHGPGGSFYGSDLGKDKTPEQLRKMVWEMCIAQGGLTVSKREVDAMTAYHRSIMFREPFVEVIQMTPAFISGEATPGTTITIVSGTRTIPATIKDNHWEASVESHKRVSITATRGGKTIQLPVTLGGFSLHPQPTH